MYVFHITITTEHIVGESQFQQRQSAAGPDVQMTSLDVFRLSDILDGPETRDFKYSHNQMSADVKSGDRGGHGNLQPLLIFLPFTNVYIRKAFARVAV